MQIRVPKPFNRKKRALSPAPTCFSLIDLGTDTIKLAVVEAGPQGQIRVLGHSLASAGGKNPAGGRGQAAALTEVINIALQQAEDATELTAGRKIVPDYALFVLPGQTTRGRYFEVKQRRGHPARPVSGKEIDALWERALRLTQQGLLKLPGIGPEWLPQTVTAAGLWLDGHLVNDPFGLQGRQLTLAVYGATCQPGIIRAIERLAACLELEIYRLVPAAQSLATIVPAREALVFNVGAGGTECSLIRHDALTAAAWFPLGGRFFTQSISRAFKCPVDDAESLKVAFAAQTLSADDERLVQKSLHTPLNRWVGDIINALAAMPGVSPSYQLPGNLYFTGGSAVLPGLKNRLLLNLREAGFSFGRSPEVVNLGEGPLTDFIAGPTAFRGILFAPVLSLSKTV